MTANHTALENGRVTAICSACKSESPSVEPTSDGEPDILLLPLGWSVIWLPSGHKHANGSTGSIYTCPACNDRLA